MSSTLVASAEATDLEEGPLDAGAFFYQWLKNSSLIPSATSATLRGQFAKGDQISVEVTATDSGGEQSESKKSDEIPIQNSPSTAPMVRFPAGAPTTPVTLTPEITRGTDLDGDLIIVRISWFFKKPGETEFTKQTDLEGSSTAGPRIPKGTVVKVEVVSNDEEIDSPPATTAFTIANVLPSIGTLGRRRVRENKAFSIPIRVADADGDPVIVGVLVVSLGMFAAFQIQDAAADHSSLSCLVKIDKIYLTVAYIRSDGPTGKTRMKNTTCLNCITSIEHAHMQREYEMVIDAEYHYKHRYLGSSSWSYCHAHCKTLYPKRWATVLCGV